MSLDKDTRQAIENLLTENPVVLFMKGNRQQPQCGFSAKTVSALDMLVPDYVTIDVLQYPQVRDGIKEYGNWPTIPQLYIKGELIGGSDIVLEMMQSGELAEALDVEVPQPDTPKINIGKGAAEVMISALQAQPDMRLHLQIDAAWSHTLSLSPPMGAGIEAESAGVKIYMDPWTAIRGNGLCIELGENLSGTSFQFDNPNAPPPVNQMAVRELKEKLDKGEALNVFDVRGDDERNTAKLGFARAWSQEALAYIESLPKDAELIFHCHVGGRSQNVAEQFRRKGYTNVHNLKGGIKAWSAEIDPGIPDY